MILIVEDSATDERLAVRALGNAGVTDISVARDGHEAVSFLNDSRCPQLMLLDLKLPKLNGLEVLRHVRSQSKTRYCPVVVFTSSNETLDIVNCLEAGANSYIQKPIDFEQYLQVLGRMADYWLSVDANCKSLA